MSPATGKSHQIVFFSCYLFDFHNKPIVSDVLLSVTNFIMPKIVEKSIEISIG